MCAHAENGLHKCLRSSRLDKSASRKKRKVLRGVVLSELILCAAKEMERIAKAEREAKEEAKKLMEETRLTALASRSEAEAGRHAAERAAETGERTHVAVRSLGEGQLQDV